MKKCVQLPIVQPSFSAYQYQGSGGAVIATNPSINNWYINQCVLLECNAWFLTMNNITPHVTVESSNILDIPVFEKHGLSVRFLKGSIHRVIRAMIDEGYYVYMYGADDYYIRGKSLYHQDHFFHDGLICGYDQNLKNYSVFSYDFNWVYRIFQTPQLAIEKGLLYPGCRHGEYANVYAIKPQEETVQINPMGICEKLKEYLENTLEKQQLDEPEIVKGIAVLDVIWLYLDKMYNGQVPYAARDHRIFRTIRDHKVVMYERIRCLEEMFAWDKQLSTEYKTVVHMAEQLRMVYAFYMKKQRNELLIDIKKKTLVIKEKEEKMLRKLIKKLEGALQHDAMEQTT